ncbi:MAG: response regulator [Sphingomonadaceae bacterium]|nr:response regulator [Sphingomonadaceae bacterium]
MNLITFTQPFRSQRWAGYILAILLSFGAVWLRMAVGPALSGFPFLTFFGAVVIAAFLGGLGPGIAAVIASALLANVYMIDPVGAFAYDWPRAWVAMTLFIATSGLAAWLLHRMLVAHKDDTAHKRELEALNNSLERLVEERTAALKQEMAEREEAETQLRHLQKMESLGQLTGGIAHDFNNMLAVVIGMLDIAKRRMTGAEDPKVVECIDNAVTGAERAATLTARLLAFSRQQPLEPSAFDANGFVANMSEIIGRSIGEHIEVDTVLADGLWHAFADAARLENAILNLAVNGRDAMPDGGKLTIETGNAELDEYYVREHPEVRPGQYVMICITDNGCGMPREVVDRVFDPFFTTKEVGKGTGLGLSQVYGFVKQSGGHIKIYSEIGAGTAVKIYLPRHLGDLPVSVEDVGLAGDLPLGSKEIAILVVEDDDNVRQMTVDTLLELGYGVIAAAGAHEALRMIADRPSIDLLFTDVVMPAMNGRELADIVSESHPNIAVLFTTGYTRNAVVHNGLLDDGVSFLPKPFTLEQLAHKVHETLAAKDVNGAE